MIRKAKSEFATFSWEYSVQDQTQLGRFLLYCVFPGTAMPTVQKRMPPNDRTTNLSMASPQGGVHKYYMTALGANGVESDPSNTVEIEVYEGTPQANPLPSQPAKPPAPGNLRAE